MKVKWLAAVVVSCIVLTVLGNEDNLLKNQDFSEKDVKGKIAYWQSSNPEALLAENGILKKNVTALAARSKAFTGGVYQLVKEWKPGNYEFSGCYRGELTALFVVVRGYTAERKNVDLLVKWIPRKEFRADESKPGWNRFFYQFSVPANCVSGSVHIEGWNSQKGSMELMKIELAEAEE